jgi:hypothetical protein
LLTLADDRKEKKEKEKKLFHRTLIVDTKLVNDNYSFATTLKEVDILSYI